MAAILRELIGSHSDVASKLLEDTLKELEQGIMDSSVPSVEAVDVEAKLHLIQVAIHLVGAFDGLDEQLDSALARMQNLTKALDAKYNQFECRLNFCQCVQNSRKSV